MEIDIVLPRSVKGTFNTKPALGCTLLGVIVIDDSHIRLLFPPGACCDMTAAVKLGKSIVPDVTTISTYAGKIPDTEYRLVGKKWEAGRLG